MMIIGDASNTKGAKQARQTILGSELTFFFREIRENHSLESITFLCIGTDRSTGDAFGPLVGTKLTQFGISQVIGTMPAPCDAYNLESRLRTIPSSHIIVAIDACLGTKAYIGSYSVSSEPLFPAQSVGGKLPAVGHYSVAGIVNANGPKPYWTLQMTSLHHVMLMADEVAQAVASAFDLI